MVRRAFPFVLLFASLGAGGSALAQNPRASPHPNAIDLGSRERFHALALKLPHAPNAWELESLFSETAQALAREASVSPSRFRFWVSNLGSRGSLYLGGGVFIIHAAVFREFATEERFSRYFADLLSRAIVQEGAGYRLHGAAVDVARSSFDRWLFCAEQGIAASDELSAGEASIALPADPRLVARASELKHRFLAALASKKPFRGYLRLRDNILSDRYQVYGELCASPKLRRADELYRLNDWGALLALARSELRSRPSHELWRWLEAVSLGNAGKPDACLELTQKPWIHFDERREHLRNACTALKGEWVLASSLATATAEKFSDDFQTQFWKVFFKARSRSPLRADLESLERRWGDRPGLRALNILYFGSLEKPREAAKNIDFRSDADQYQPWEWGALHFANAWLKNMYAPEFGDDRIHALREEASRNWGFSSAFWPHFARSR